MQNRIEPPILLSRLLTLVFAATLVVLVVLLITLYNMFPLNRPEVFLLRSANLDNARVMLTQVLPDDKSMEYYKKSYITEYVKLRNEIYQNAHIMDKNWNSQNGMVRAMSTNSVFADFANTSMFHEFQLTDGNFGFSCSVEFPTNPVNSYTRDDWTYTVDFWWFCTKSNGQTARKDYRIKITLMADNNQSTKWVDHMKNPLGLLVTGYSVESGDGDPLDAFVIGRE